MGLLGRLMGSRNKRRGLIVVDCRGLGRLRINRRSESNGGEVVMVGGSEPSMATAGF